ncbi:hypothetical protein JXA12_02245 [Candidatus Woesearchaeota archaeon]|nr:hypothetical protein [Candidatus Woesearchaeota archaeon]
MKKQKTINHAQPSKGLLDTIILITYLLLVIALITYFFHQYDELDAKILWYYAFITLFLAGFIKISFYVCRNLFLEEDEVTKAYLQRENGYALYSLLSLLAFALCVRGTIPLYLASVWMVTASLWFIMHATRFLARFVKDHQHEHGIETR